MSLQDVRSGLIFNFELQIHQKGSKWLNVGVLIWACPCRQQQHGCPHHFLSHFLHTRPKISALIEKIGKGNPFLWDWVSLCLTTSFKEDYICGREQASVCGRKVLYNIFIRQLAQTLNNCGVEFLLKNHYFVYKTWFCSGGIALTDFFTCA